MSRGWAGIDKAKIHARILCFLLEVTEFECESTGKRNYSSLVCTC